jgi:hypothetical protein
VSCFIGSMECCHCALKHLGQAVDSSGVLEVCKGQFLETHKLDYWNGTVLNFAHGMFMISIEFMHTACMCALVMHAYCTCRCSHTMVHMLRASPLVC